LRKLSIESEPLREYIESALPEITSVISIACEKRIPGSVFIEFAYPDETNGITFDFGRR
jgi:hypothetical protein